MKLTTETKCVNRLFRFNLIGHRSFFLPFIWIWNSWNKSNFSNFWSLAVFCCKYFNYYRRLSKVFKNRIFTLKHSGRAESSSIENKIHVEKNISDLSNLFDILVILTQFGTIFHWFATLINDLRNRCGVCDHAKTDIQLYSSAAG